MILLCYSLAAAIGGGLYEHIVLTPMWSKSPPSSFSIIQPTTGVPLQRFWIPVHAAITLFIILSLMMTWSDITVRRTAPGRSGLLYRHAGVEFPFFHSRDARISERAT